MQSVRPPRVLTFLALFFFSTPALLAQGRIVGEVHINGADFSGPVMVELDLHGAPITSVYTDEQGKFGFPSLSSNLYHVIIRDERFYPIDERVLLDLSISATQMVQLHLTRRQEAKQDSLARQSGSNPDIVDLKEYRRHFPKAALKEFDKGVRADREGKRDEAIQHYEKALSLAPEFYPAHNNLGSDYLSRSDFKSAQAHFQEAIKLNKSDAEAHLNLGNVFLMTKDYPEALKNVEEGLKREPNSALGKFLLGSIYERMEKFPEAEQTLKEALNLDPKMSRVRLELVNLYLVQKKTFEARTELKAFLRDSPNDPFAPKAKEVLEKLEASQ
jgi:tetratricopeptide (TPR) repeat protein